MNNIYKLVLIRHGQSVFNKEKIFCGWMDSELTEQGLAEAHKAGINLKEKGFTFDVAYTSLLTRAMKTLDIVLSEMDISQIPVNHSWRLNERHYGALQGIKHEEMIAKYGLPQVQIWRRSFSTRPPLLEESDPRNSFNDPRYANIDKNLIPRGESLEDTIKRVLPYWSEEIVPVMKSGKKVIVAASGNSLRALIKHIDGISDDDIVGLEIKTGTPLVYELDLDTLKPLRHYYLE